jgi:hypothetical protein
MPTPEEVISYLEQHPDFLEKHETLLSQLVHGDTSASSPFTARQIQVLKERERRQNAKIDLIVDSARSNQKLEGELLEMAVYLLQEGQQAEDPSQAVTNMLVRQFNIRDAAVLIDSGDIETRHGKYDEVRQRVAHRGSVCDDRLPSSLLETLFGENSPEIKSCAFVPIQARGELTGILALASTERERFQPGMGVLFLDRIGCLIGAYLRGRKVASG